VHGFRGCLPIAFVNGFGARLSKRRWRCWRCWCWRFWQPAVSVARSSLESLVLLLELLEFKKLIIDG